MNEYKFQFFTLLLVIVLGFGVSWAFTNLDYGNPNYRDLVQEEDEEIIVVADPAPVVPIRVVEEIPEEEVEIELTGEEAALVFALEKLVADNINMKKGSKGTRVGTVQKFLNWYFDTNKTVDNEYGPGTMADVKKFQSKEGIGDDGLAGANTYRKMIEVIEN